MSFAARVLRVMGAFVCLMGWIVPQSPNFRTPSGVGRECSKMQFLPPSCRFPPLREGNRAGVRFACRGNLKEGVRNFANFRTPSANPLINAPEMGYNSSKRCGEWTLPHGNATIC
jgi:hypothetical protein